MSTWDKYFMDMAKHVSTKSKDRSTKVGCVITTQDNCVVSTGYNGFPRGCLDEGKDVHEGHIYPDHMHIPGEPIPDAVARLQMKVEDRHERPLKYKWAEHAERNAIYSVARNGGPALKGCKIYVPWFPCVDCSRAIIQAGISALYAYEPDFNDPRWGEDFRISAEMLTEAGVHIVYVPKEV